MSAFTVADLRPVDLFDDLSDEELAEWVGPLRELSGQAQQAFVLFNNNGRSPDGQGGWVAQAATNAVAMRKLLSDAGVPTTEAT